MNSDHRPFDRDSHSSRLAAPPDPFQLNDREKLLQPLNCHALVALKLDPTQRVDAAMLLLILLSDCLKMLHVVRHENEAELAAVFSDYGIRCRV